MVPSGFGPFLLQEAWWCPPTFLGQEFLATAASQAHHRPLKLGLESSFCYRDSPAITASPTVTPSSRDPGISQDVCAIALPNPNPGSFFSETPQLKTKEGLCLGQKDSPFSLPPPPLSLQTLLSFCRIEEGDSFWRVCLFPFFNLTIPTSLFLSCQLFFSLLLPQSKFLCFFFFLPLVLSLRLLNYSTSFYAISAVFGFCFMSLKVARRVLARSSDAPGCLLPV